MNSNNSNNQTDINEIRYLIVNFLIEDSLRFLSHSQTLSLFQRAIIRSDITPEYSKGFNPRPKISLPLPRPLGVESDDEFLVMPISIEPERIYEFLGDSEDSSNKEYIDNCFNSLSKELPEGCKLKNAKIVREKPRLVNCHASYIFTIPEEEMNENLQKKINCVLANESLVLERSIKNKNTTKKIDVRGFLSSIIIKQNSIIVRCEISSAGSIRIQEMMELLGLNAEKLVCPIKRTNVQWLL